MSSENRLQSIIKFVDVRLQEREDNHIYIVVDLAGERARDKWVYFQDVTEDFNKLKVKGADYLNISLSLLGLETNEYFHIDDPEFPETYFVDSFGDVFVIDFNGDEHEDDFLTLGRLLTQYPDKIIKHEEMWSCKKA